MTIEIFTDCKLFPDLFKVSNFGQVFSKRTGKILVQGISKTGYRVISTRIGGRSGIAKCIKVSRMVASAFIDNPLNKPVVNHIDGNKLNNNSTNLEWVTHSENTIHAVETGLLRFDSVKGFKTDLNRNAEKNAFAIVKLYFVDKLSMRKIGEIYKVNHQVISKIIKQTIPS